MEKGIDSVIDGHKIYLHPEKVTQWKQTGDCYPIHVEIDLTNRCNHNCIFCGLDFDRGKEEINKDIILRALEDMAKHEVKSVMFTGGEPTLHPDLSLFVQKAKEYGLDVALTTNGSLFNKKIQEECLPYLSWVKFSIDAGTPQTYEKTHRTNSKNFYKLIENIDSSIKMKNEKKLNVTIGTQYLIIPQSINKKDINRIINILKEIKPGYLSIKPYSDHPRSPKNLIVTEKDYEKLEEILGNVKNEDLFKIFFRKETIKRVQEEKTYNECYGLSFYTLIDSRGDVLPCNLFYEQEEFVYGNIYKNNFNEIWEGEKRKKVLNRLRIIGTKNCRKGCRCDAGNEYLCRIKNPQPHDNFT
jgi:cyclic pyranopterin phosphate synthase